MKRWFLTVVIALSYSSVSLADDEDVAALLGRNETDRVEKILGDVQHRFESGVATEIELRNAFRPIYKLDSSTANNLNKWAGDSPNSYSAHLALGIYLKKVGLAARGEKFIAETPERNLATMQRYLEKAETELRASLSLTKKPYLSVFHLLDIAAHLGDKQASKELVAKANNILPSNALARNRYIVSLMPRWGGSYNEAEYFIAQSLKARVPPEVIWQLEAIKSDDIGHGLEERGQLADARANFENALQLATKVGGTFSADFLSVSRYYMCSRSTAVSCR